MQSAECKMQNFRRCGDRSDVAKTRARCSECPSVANPVNVAGSVSVPDVANAAMWRPQRCSEAENFALCTLHFALPYSTVSKL